jgi:hypothetical protein
MANVSKNALQSKLAHVAAGRIGPAGMPHNPQDFSALVGMRAASYQDYLRGHWEYLTAHRMAHANRLSTRFRDPSGPVIDRSTGQLAFASIEAA